MSTLRSVCFGGFRRFSPIICQFSSFPGAMSLSQVEDVDIDASGTFKYILIKAKSSNEEKFIVRGYARCSYHADIFDVVRQKTPKNIDLDCVGGGRIKHEPKRLEVYGYSQGFGRADHKKSVEILKKKYPDYEITSSNDGY